MASILCLIFFVSLSVAVFVPNLVQQASTPSSPMNGDQLPPLWSSFYWNATGSYRGSGTIQNQVLYPFKTLNAAGPNFIGIDVENKVFKMNFTVGGMQKTTQNGTWLTFAAGGPCWFIPRWTYDVQVLSYTYATLKKDFSSQVGMWTGIVEDVSSCATTVAVTLMTKQNRVTQWNFAGGYPVQGLGSVYFDYQLTYDKLFNGVPPQSDSYWALDPSCANPSQIFCANLFSTCGAFLQGFKPTSGTPDCECTNC